MAYLLEILPFCKIEHLSYRINIDIEMVYYEPNKHTIQLISSSGRIVLGLSIEVSLEETRSCLLQSTVYSLDLGEASALRKTGQFCLHDLPKRVQRGSPLRVKHCCILVGFFSPASSRCSPS